MTKQSKINFITSHIRRFEAQMHQQPRRVEMIKDSGNWITHVGKEGELQVNTSLLKKCSLDLFIMMVVKSLYQDHKEVKHLQNDFKDILRPVEIRGEVLTAKLFCEFQGFSYKDVLRTIRNENGAYKEFVPGKCSFERFIEFNISTMYSLQQVREGIFVASINEFESTNTVKVLSLSDWSTQYTLRFLSRTFKSIRECYENGHNMKELDYMSTVIGFVNASIKQIILQNRDRIYKS